MKRNTFIKLRITPGPQRPLSGFPSLTSIRQLPKLPAVEMPLRLEMTCEAPAFGRPFDATHAPSSSAAGGLGCSAGDGCVTTRPRTVVSECASSTQVEHVRQGSHSESSTGTKVKGAKPPRQIDLDGPGYLRLVDVLKVLAVSRATYYAKMKLGIYPASVALGPRARGWTRASIRDLIARIEAGELSGS